MRPTLQKSLFGCAAAALLLVACNNNRSEASQDSIQPFNDTTQTFDTTNLRHDTTAASDTSLTKRPNVGGQDTVRFSEHD